MLRLEFHAMGCQMLVAAENESFYAERRLSEVPSLFADWEQTLSRFRPDSELNRLNDQAGKWVSVSPVIWEVMHIARDAWEQSEGLITPAVLPALESVGYSQSFELISSGTSDDVAFREKTVQTFQEIKFDEGERCIFLPSGMRLDLGGVAKGWAAHKAMAHLRDLGPVLMDSGGDIAISASLKGGEPWAIGVNDPFNRGEHIESVFVYEGGVATSGQDHRRWQQGAEWRHHIIDPRTGLPAETDLLSVTVIAENVMKAEMAAKTVLILGSEDGMDWLDHLDNASGLAIMENRELLGSHSIEKYLRN